MSAARSRRCRRLRFLRAERLRRGGASHRPPAARPGSSRRRGRGEGPGSAGDGCEWARSLRRVRPGIGSERAGRWRLVEGARGRPGAAWGRWGRGRHGAGTGLAPGTGAVRDPQPGPAHLPRCPGARRPGLAGRRLRCRTSRETAPGPRSSCRTQAPLTSHQHRKEDPTSILPSGGEIPSPWLGGCQVKMRSLAVVGPNPMTESS
ncbi:uncharacterized protein [Physeter macrocephalus]|uniref:Uncharacterized protein n=1 Tax=Physeter macrocephalus TaxID=9755 RepID=A0A9W2WQ32_PHYMC|nr:uncharacterized protein LOC114486356 [Physeter catodon]